MALQARKVKEALAMVSEHADLASEEQLLLAEANRSTTEAAETLKESLYAAAAAAQELAGVVDIRNRQVFNERLSDVSFRGPSAMETVPDQITQMATQAANKWLLQTAPKGAEKAAHHKGGGGGTKIQKVEIVVTSNQSPSRIARETVNELGKLSRAPTSSKYRPNFSGVSRT